VKALQRAHTHPAAVVLLLFAWLAITASIRPFTAPDEGRYVGIAYAMLRSGDWIVPRLDGLPFFHKPPLFYWLGAASMAVWGPQEWAARLPSVLGATLGSAALFLFLRRWSTPQRATLSMVILATMPFFYVGAQFANLDMLVAGCIAATVLCAAWATLAREEGGDTHTGRSRWRAPLAAAYLFAALGVLSKGLIGFLLPGLVHFVWCLVTRRPRALRLLAWLPGWGLFLVVAGPWFVAMQMRYPEFFDYFVVTQHFRRFATEGFNNPYPFWFYLPVMAGLTLPWSGWALVAAWRRRAGRRSLSDVDWLMVVWLAVIVVFFSIPRSKLVGYVLPGLPPLACLVAALLTRPDAPTRTPKPLRWTALGAVVLCVGSVVAVARFATPPGARLRLPPGSVIADRDRVVMLDTYYYEIPLYWKLHDPVIVVGSWQASKRNLRDDWRKEFNDAARFDPVRAESLLPEESALPAMLCHPKDTTWLIARLDALQTREWLAKKAPVVANEQVAVWRFSNTADCKAFTNAMRTD
jgi:4-amino-4-deoxy-L-arabinose transferase-like glycosyltransferase